MYIDLSKAFPIYTGMYILALIGFEKDKKYFFKTENCVMWENFQT